jgi:hypothetical protein
MNKHVKSKTAADRAGSLFAYRESVEDHMQTVEDQDTVSEQVSDAGEIRNNRRTEAAGTDHKHSPYIESAARHRLESQKCFFE